METGLEITIDDAEFQAKLANIIVQLGSQSSGLMRAIGYYMRRRTVQHFADENDPEGQAWEPLKESTVRGRMSLKRRNSYDAAQRAQGRAALTIQRAERTIARAQGTIGRAANTGLVTRAQERIARAQLRIGKARFRAEKAGNREARARGKILQDSGDLRKSIESLSDATTAEIGTNMFYGPFHQFGAPRAHIPIRAFLGVADEDAEGITNLAWDYLVRVTGG